MSKKIKAVGVHVFAGGFTMGVRRVADVQAQMEVFGLGIRTVRESLKLPVVMPDGSDDPVVDQWLHSKHHRGCAMCYGNPRCTGFSVLNTSKGKSGGRGPWARQNIDIRQLCEYGVRGEFPIICWESVQQAFTTGRPLLDYLRDEVLVPKKYRIAHVLLNAATFGNAQHRKRYFFVAYRDDLTFEPELPPLIRRHTTVRDVIGSDAWLKREAVPVASYKKGVEAGPDTYCRHPHDDEWGCIPELLPGESINDLARLRPERIEIPGRERLYEATVWAMSGMPFGMHGLTRLDWDKACPVITGSSCWMVHPQFDRTLTSREIAALMGWPLSVTPVGDVPGAQVGKGIVPAVGEWLARQAQMCVDGDMRGEEEHEVLSVGAREDTRDTHVHAVRPIEKVIDLTRWCPRRPA